MIDPRITDALEQIAVLAEYGTTGAGACKSGPLTAAAATSLRLAISTIARDALAVAAHYGVTAPGNTAQQRARAARDRL